MTPAKKIIVIVDDEIEICESLKDIFEDEGYAVATASDGARGLALLQSIPTKPCLVILDLLMPVMDGNEVYQAMRADPALASVPVVVSTSDPSHAPSGVLIIKKPVNVDVLMRTVRNCC